MSVRRQCPPIGTETRYAGKSLRRDQCLADCSRCRFDQEDARLRQITRIDFIADRLFRIAARDDHQSFAVGMERQTIRDELKASRFLAKHDGSEQAFLRDGIEE
jgi:hypothetical protein